ncbi:MAG: 5'-nucleotidase C-terminal domain-containing protein, partial [Clostridia bacterium]|nr:5'-nucleotidase C-terminal domain-containing protein [Clostridia bacterium]
APERDEEGNLVRMIRRGETNLGDFCADAYRILTGADIAVMNGGGIRQNIAAGDVTYGDIIKVHPFGNQLCVIEATGQQIIDALEWGAHATPGEFGGFLQVSGLSYEIDLSVENHCITDENGLFVRVDGEYRVKNVRVGNEAIDPNAIYKVAGTDYTLINHGDGFTSFDGATLLQDRIKLDNQVLLEYIVTELNGRISDKYADLRGQGRITITNND